MTDGFDAVFLSYDEPLADELYARLADRFGAVKRLHGVRGMRRAYRLTADMVDTEAYFIADADLDIDPQFDPASVPPLEAGVSMRVWRTVNAVNGLTYGYGGLKLVRHVDMLTLGETVDVLAALPGRTEFTRQVAGRTRFNQSPLHAWRAGFRECAMLTRGCEYGTARPDAQARIHTWTSQGDGPYSAHARTGAAAGVAFARQAATDAAAFEVLNDPSWLATRFAAQRVA
jgi:hypothetical protein